MPEVDRIARLCVLFSVSADELLGLPHREERAQVQKTEQTDMERMLQAGFYRRVFTMGSIAALVAAVMLAVAWLSLWAIRNHVVEIAISHGFGFRSDVMWYAGQMPMSAVFALGGVMLTAGICLAVCGLIGGKKRGKQENKD